MSTVRGRGRSLEIAVDRAFAAAVEELRAQFADRPDVQKAIDDGLSKVEEEPLVGRRAFALRDVLLQIKRDVQAHPRSSAAEAWG